MVLLTMRKRSLSTMDYAALQAQVSMQSTIQNLQNLTIKHILPAKFKFWSAQLNLVEANYWQVRSRSNSSFSHIFPTKYEYVCTPGTIFQVVFNHLYTEKYIHFKGSQNEQTICHTRSEVAGEIANVLVLSGEFVWMLCSVTDTKYK